MRRGPQLRHDNHDLVQPLLYSSWRRHRTPVSLRRLGAQTLAVELYWGAQPSWMMREVDLEGVRVHVAVPRA